MDGLFVLIVLLLLAAPVIGIVALIRSITDRNLLRHLDARMKALEGARVAATPAMAEPAPAPATIVVAPAEPTPSPAPPTPPPTSVPLSSPSPVQSSAPQKIGFEEKFGTRWVVWVGGVALALGGIFLVRYTIQQGLIGPGVRIFLGALLALALVAAGEWARRTEKLSALSGVPSAHIPGTLTAAGTTVAYATVYAAYGLYGFLPPAVAFILLGAVALLTLGAALLHGPALAGLGVIGAYLAPMLVASAKPDFWSLYVYIAVVNAAAFALARLRMWRWLAIAAIVLGALWTLPGTQTDTVTALGAHVFHALAGFALVATFLVCGLLYGPPAAPGVIDRLSTLALVVYLLAAAFLVLASRHDPVALTAFVVLTVATVAIAWRTEAAAGAVPAAAVLAALVMAHWAVHMNVQGLLAPSGPAAPAIPEPERYDYGWHLILAAGWAALFGAGGFLAQGRSSRALVPMLWSAAAVFAPLAMLVALYYRIAQLDRSLPFAALALLRRRDLCARDRGAGETRAATRLDGGGRDVRHRHARRAGAGVDLCAGEGLAHHRAGSDGAGHRLDRGTTAAALAALAGRHHGRRGGRARRLRAAHRRRRSRHHADLQLAAVRLRRPGRRILGRGMAVAAPRRRSAGAHGRRRRHSVHGAARGPGDPSLRHRRRYLPSTEQRRGSHAPGQCRPGDDHWARTRARTHRQHRAQCRGAVDRGADAIRRHRRAVGRLGGAFQRHSGGRRRSSI